MGRETLAEDVRVPGDGDRPSRAYFRLLRGLERAEGFTLFLAQCDSHDVRRETIARAEAALADSGKSVVAVDLSQTDDPLGKLLPYCAASPPVIMAFGLGESPDDDTRLIRVLRRLNHERERFRDELACPLVLWLDQRTISLMARHAPDFYDWRSALLVFEADSFDGMVASEARTEAGIIAPGRETMPVTEARAKLPPLLDLLDELRAGRRTPRNRASLMHVGQRAAYLLMDAGQFEEAIGLLHELLEFRDGQVDDEDTAGVLASLASACTFTPGGDRRQNLQRAIDHCERALTVYTQEGHPPQWAGIQNILAIAYGCLPTGDRTRNIERSIKHCEAALSVWTRTDFAYEWAGIQNNLAVAYSQRPAGNEIANLRRAIRYCEAAFTVRTEDSFPVDWAATQNNLGNAYRALRSGDGAQNLHRAIDCYQATLRVYTEDGFPAEWARAQRNLGNAYRNLPTGDITQHLVQAVARYEAALRVYSEDTFPAFWAGTLNDLGVAYRRLRTGDRAHNLHRAIECYQAALRVRTERDFPVEWAETTLNMGVLLDEDWPEGAEENRQRAIECFRATLRVYTCDSFPEEYILVRDVLAELGVEVGADE